jgi:hypothetical protein
VNTAQEEEEEEEEEEDEEMEMEGGDVFLDSQDPCESLLPAIEELYLVRDTFFPLDPTIKKARLDNLMREALVVLAEIAAGGLSHFLSLKREQFAVVIKKKIPRLVCVCVCVYFGTVLVSFYLLNASIWFVVARKRELTLFRIAVVFQNAGSNRSNERSGSICEGKCLMLVLTTAKKLKIIWRNLYSHLAFFHQTFFVEKNYVVLLTLGWKDFCYRF